MLINGMLSLRAFSLTRLLFLWSASSVFFSFLTSLSHFLCRYIETIYKILKPGGVWINIGPLLYHWVADVDANDDPRYDQSIEVWFPSFIFLLIDFVFYFFPVNL